MIIKSNIKANHGHPRVAFLSNGSHAAEDPLLPQAAKTIGPTTLSSLEAEGIDYSIEKKGWLKSKKKKKKERMGGDHHQHGAAEGDFRTKVWSMTGGPNCRPKHWKRNTAIAMFGIFLTCIPIAMISVQLEQRPHHPVRPIPSQLWCKNFGKKEY